MMNRITIIVSALMLLAIACSREEGQGEGATTSVEQREISFMADAAIASRATVKNEWELGDMVGITMSGNGEEFNNYEYTVSLIDGSDTQFSYYGEDMPLLYPNHGFDITLYAYSPYGDSVWAEGGVLSVGLDCDFMVSDVKTYTSEVYSENPSISFTFKHLLSYVEVKISPSDEIPLEKLADMSVYLDTHHTSITYDIDDGSMVSTSSGAVYFDSQANGNGGYTATSFILPISYSGEVWLHFDNGADYHSAVLFDTSSYVAGKCYSYTAEIGDDEVALRLSDIEEWGDTVDGAIGSLEEPDGSEGSPWLISTADDLAAIGGSVMGVGDYYYITNDINVSGTWTTLCSSSHFTGHIAGNGYTISGLSSSEDDVALFKYISSIGYIENLNIADCSFTGGFVAGIAYTNYGYIYNCSVTGSMGATGESYIGGVVGYNYGSIINCWSNVKITSANWAGGIAIYNEYDIGGCYSLGDISTNSNNAMCGGIVGYNCVGSTSGYVGACYSAGSISGNSSAENIGSITGKCDSGAITERSYYANDTSGVNYNKSCHGKSTEYMKSQAFVVDLNSEKIDGNAGSYPSFDWVNNTIGVGFPVIEK